MLTMVGDCRVYKNNQTLIPKKIREKYNVNENTIVEWFIDEHDEPVVRFRGKKTIDDMIGAVELGHPIDSVQAKKELYL